MVCSNPKTPPTVGGDISSSIVDVNVGGRSNDNKPADAGNGTDICHKDDTPVNEARKGLLKAMWQTSMAPRFSSKPIAVEDFFSSSLGSFGATSVASPASSTRDIDSSLISSSKLTAGERKYLENLLKSEDLESIRKASERLADKDLFPPMHSEEKSELQDSSPSRHKVLSRRDSDLQQQLYKLHEETTYKPSHLLRKMSSTMTAATPELSNSKSLGKNESWHPDSDDDEEEEKKGKDPVTSIRKKWNPFTDVSSWIDGNKGVELDDDGNPIVSVPLPTSSPFKILGTSGTDTSCHPHVLSPPLMEGLQGFMPESLHEHNFLLKYSLVRDGPGLLTMMKHCRASNHTILAIETTSGHVFGCYTSQPWRLSPGESYYGSSESFLWRMRRSRDEPCTSLMEQAMNESKLDVFPYTCRNKNVKFCTSERLAIGDTEVVGMSSAGQHYGNAIRLNGTLNSGSTSTSETFGNPCLIDAELRGMEFKVSNVELWTMTQHATMEDAEEAESQALFMEEGRATKNNLNLMEILVATPRGKRVQHF